MNRKQLVIAAAALAVCLTTTIPVQAGLISGAPRGTTTHTFNIPGQEFFDGGFLFVDGFGPDVGSIVTNTTVNITYVSDGATPASELDVHIGMTVDNTFLETVLTGTDLGFGSGPGTFIGSFSTADLNGEATSFFGPSAALSLQIGSINDPPFIDGSGYFVDSTIVFDIIPVPEPGALALLAMGIPLALRRRRAAS